MLCDVFGVGGAERYLAGSIAIAWDAQVPGIAQVRAEPDVVIAHNLRPVIHHLILVFRLEQMAVACIYLQTGTEA